MVLTQIGGPLEWTDLPDRQPGPGQVRVAVSACGVCTESRVSAPEGLEIRLRVLRLVSLHDRAIGLQVVEVDAGHAEATLEASFDGLEFGLIPERLEQDLGIWRTNTTGKRLEIAASASLLVDGRPVQPKALRPFRWAWTWAARPGQAVHFERVVALVRDDVPVGKPGEAARDRLAAAVSLGWAGILDQHEASWAQRWRDSGVVVGGDPDAQHALRFALYHLNSAANPHDEMVSIAARALTGADYHGHVFWDTEIYLLPFYTLTWPEAARALLRACQEITDWVFLCKAVLGSSTHRGTHHV